MKCKMTWINLFQFHPLNLDFFKSCQNVDFDYKSKLRGGKIYIYIYIYLTRKRERFFFKLKYDKG